MDNEGSSDLRQWIGESWPCEERLELGPITRFDATFDNAQPSAAREGDIIPLGAHWLYFITTEPHARLDTDGHPKRGGFLPPVPLPRRMWAGSRIEYLASLHVGEKVRKISRIANITEKEGKSGRLIFVTVRHEYEGTNGLALIEDQELVYRGKAAVSSAMSPDKPTARAASWTRTIVPDPVMLFRYSAITFNAHRIHYDHVYTTHIEEYPRLVVQGQLIATHLLKLTRDFQPNPPLKWFQFRALNPLYVNEPFTVCGRPDRDGTAAELWAQDARGRVAMTAQARFA